jgi:hypothetical protein
MKPMECSMRIALWLAAMAALASTAPAYAERPDCGLFPDDRSRFACYDNVSRAPNPEPERTAKPVTSKPKAAVVPHRKIRTN